MKTGVTTHANVHATRTRLKRRDIPRNDGTRLDGMNATAPKARPGRARKLTASRRSHEIPTAANA
jgi:hypothetical protein